MRKFLLFWFWVPASMFACDCPEISMDSILARSNVVWVGTCMDVLPNPIKGDLNVVFQVDSSWKRQVEHVATIHTPNHSCGFDFKPGEKYWVVGMKRHQTLYTESCMGNLILPASLPAELKNLGKAFLPGRPEFASRMNFLLLALGGGGLLFLAFVVLRKKIMSKKQSGNIAV
jgi:hypothetical protein